MEELARRVREAAYLEGDFLLRSGRRSTFYLDKYRFETQPDLLRDLGAALAERIAAVEPDAVRIAGPELGAVALAASASMAVGLPFVIVRGAAKAYGTGNRLEGVAEPGERIAMVEDVVTSGGAALEAVEALREAGLVCETVVCVVDRGEGGAEAMAAAGVGLHALLDAAASAARPALALSGTGSHGLRNACSWPSCTRHSRRNRMVERKIALPTAMCPSDTSGSVRLSLNPTGRHEQVTKAEFIDQVAAKSGLAKKDAARAVDAFIETVSSTLRGGGDVSFTGFGKFHVASRAARTGVNPRSGEKVQIPAGKVPKFSPGSALKEAVKT